MTEREFYKRLKEEKLFTKFYLHLSCVFVRYPKLYIKSLTNGERGNIERYIDSIKGWTKKYNFKDITIMQK